MRNKLFSTIYGNVGSNIQDSSSAMQTIIKRYCNDAYFEILKRVNWEALKPSYQITTVANQQDYILPSDFGKEKYVHDNTNKRYIPFISLSELVETYPETLSSVGSPDFYTIIQDVVRNQPTSASTVSIASSSASDTTQSVLVRGTDANDIELSESVTLTGTTPAVTTNSYKEIRSITKSATTVGRITGTSNSAAVTNFVMAPADLDYKVKKLRLHYIPSSIITLNVPYYINPYPLSHDNDVPVFDCADGIELGATHRSWLYKRQGQKAQQYEILFEKWIVDTAWNQENQPNQTHTFSPKTYDRDDI